MAAADSSGRVSGTSRRVIVLAPFGRDAAVVCDALVAGDVHGVVAHDVAGLVTLIREGAAVVLITEEAITDANVEVLQRALRDQPSWSDLPLLLLLAPAQERGAETAARAATLRQVGNVTVLIRPVVRVALVSAIEAALRARARQFQICELIETERTARLEAQRANSIKDEFLAAVSHELRTPLSAILLWARLMAGGRLDSERWTEALDAILHSAQAQSRLVEDLLDASRLLSGKLRLETRETELAGSVERAIEAVAPMAQAKQVALDVFIDPYAGRVRADPDRIQQVVWNLLGNAVKFTPAKGWVSIHLRRKGDVVEICVQDTGAGVPPEFLPHVFERFRQADAEPARRHGGLGLGLSITQQLVELHGGRIEAQSGGAGLGATFTAHFPLLAKRGEIDGPKGPANRSEMRLVGQRVLLVEDKKETRSALQILLQHAGAELIAADTAPRALQELRRLMDEGRPPDVLLSDIGLPDQDGLTLLRDVRELERSAGIEMPIRAVAMSAYTGPDIGRRARAAGFERLLSKPIDADELILTLATDRPGA